MNLKWYRFVPVTLMLTGYFMLHPLGAVFALGMYLFGISHGIRVGWKESEEP